MDSLNFKPKIFISIFERHTEVLPRFGLMILCISFVLDKTWRAIDFAAK